MCTSRDDVIRSLWYQLTVALLEFTQQEENYVNDNMITVGRVVVMAASNAV